MRLTQEEQDILDGKHGEVMAKVMRTVVRYGEVFGAGIRYNRRLLAKGPEATPTETPALANRPIIAALADESHSPESDAASAQFAG